MRKTRTTIPLEDRDREAIAAIRAYYGVTSDVDAIRIALRELQRRIISPAPLPQGTAIPPLPEGEGHPGRKP